MKNKAGLFRAVLLITVLAGALRIYAAKRLFGYGDEPTYMKVAVNYAGILRSGRYDLLASFDQNYEHPVLYKIIYGAALLTRPPINNFSSEQLYFSQPASTIDVAPWVMADRYVSVAFGTLAVMILAIINPLAGLFFAVDILSVNYTSVVYLEALPLLTSLLCAVAYLRWFDQVSKHPSASPRINGWLAVSAVFLGLTAASKYIYCVVGIVIVLHFLLALAQRQITWRSLFYLLGWAVLAAVIFFIFDPYLWPDPAARLSQSILFNINFSHSDLVVKHPYPFSQPIRWLWAFSSYFSFNPRLAFIFDVDALIFLLAALGLPRLFQHKRFFFYWLTVGLIFLLVWNTKWSQYALIVMVPFCVSAAEGLFTARDLGRKFLIPSESAASEERKGGE